MIVLVEEVLKTAEYSIGIGIISLARGEGGFDVGASPMALPTERGQSSD
jgi:hypothetical protein